MIWLLEYNRKHAAVWVADSPKALVSDLADVYGPDMRLGVDAAVERLEAMGRTVRVYGMDCHVKRAVAGGTLPPKISTVVQGMVGRLM